MKFQCQMQITENLRLLRDSIPGHVELVAVSKTKPVSDILEAYNAGQRIFGENKVQELCEKFEQLPSDIKWHMIGHLQSNKVKYIAPFVDLIHGVDSEKLLFEIDRQAAKHDRIISCLLQVHIAQEETKFGLDHDELASILQISKELKNIKVRGLMGMATYTENKELIEKEFRYLKGLYDIYQAHFNFSILSMGMSGDYQVAINCGSNMIRVGSSIFGDRNHRG